MDKEVRITKDCWLQTQPDRKSVTHLLTDREPIHVGTNSQIIPGFTRCPGGLDEKRTIERLANIYILPNGIIRAAMQAASL